MYEETISKLQAVGVVFSEGLEENEIEKIEGCYNIKFPKELIAFYKEALPISDGFYNWRDFSKENADKIAEILKRPEEDILDDIGDIEWSDAWGEMPGSDDEIISIIVSKLNDASGLIPIYKHRYIANQYDENNPVFSIYGTDIICYGVNLEQYLLTEFKYLEQSEIYYDQINKVRFWSDII